MSNLYHNPLPHHRHQTEHGPSPADRNDHADRLLDANLGRIGAAMHASGETPAGLNPELLAAFKQSPRSGVKRDSAASSFAGSQGVPTHEPMNRARIRTTRARVAAGLSAIAAMVAIAAAVFTTGTPSSRVNAATILTSLRSRTISGVNMAFKDIRTPMASMNGMVKLRIDPPVELDTLLDHGRDAGSDDRLTATADMDVIVHEPTIDGAAFRFRAALSNDRKWFFVQNTTSGSAQGDQTRPTFAMVHLLTRSGVLVDFSDLSSDDLRLLAPLSPSPDGEPDGGNIGDHSNMRVSVGLSASSSTPGRVRPIVGIEMSDRFQSLIRQVLTGVAGSEQMGEIQNIIHDAGREATVENLGNGRFLLTVSCPAEDPRNDLATVRVTYAKDVGVESVEIVPRAPSTGSVVLTFANDPIDTQLLDPGRLTTPQTFVIDSDWIRSWLPHN